jgi:hypothetical protein
MLVRHLVLVTALSLLIPALPVLADEAGSLEELVVKMADSPEQHHALAKYYRGKASAAREEASRHRKIGASYMMAKVRARQKMKDHCNEIASGQDALAKDYDALADLHEQGAKGTAE